MKKKLFIITLLIGGILPIIVKANIIPNKVYPYKVIAIKDTKAFCEEKEISIKKGEVLEVIYEILVNDALIFKYNKEECKISMEDVKIQTKEFDVENVKNEMIFKNEIGISYSENSMIYGPSFMYETIQEIPNGTKINILGTYNKWYYIEYNNKKGWIADLLTKTEGEYINPRTQAIYSDQSGKNKIGIIDAGVKINSIYSEKSNEADKLSYITYNGITGYVFYSLYDKIDEDMILEYEGRMYEEANIDSKVLVPKIEEGTKIHVDYGTYGNGSG